MFTSTSLFKIIPCPKQSECHLPNCIFSHAPSHKNEEESGRNGAQLYDPTAEPTSASADLSPPVKRRRLESPVPLGNGTAPARLDLGAIGSGASNGHPHSHHAKRVAIGPAPVPQVNKQLPQPPAFIASNNTDNVISTARPAMRPISPPPAKKLRPAPTTSAITSSTSTKPDALVPRAVPNAPAILSTRLSLLQMIHQQMKLLNDQVAKGGDAFRALVLDPQEVVKLALDEEEDAAVTLGPEIYRNALSQRVVKLKRMSIEEWKTILLQKFGRGRPESMALISSTNSLIPTGLTSAHEQLAILRALRTSLPGLEEYGYVTKPPTLSEIDSAKQGVAAAEGWEVCDRCAVNFQVFPGRDENGRLASYGTCRHHWGKATKSQGQRVDRITGMPEAYYSCCNRSLGTEGCADCDSHVFKVTDPKRLASVLQFESTPRPADDRKRVPVAFDCEMGYTTYGLEVIRVTAISWPQKQALLDVLVRPYGVVLDLNTRFSGVSKEQFANAIPYHTAPLDEDDHNLDDGQVGTKPLRKVDTPAAARQLLFDLLTPDTPLIGHAIENDLNACRIVHPFILDTVLLYPHPRGLPVKYGLKVLSATHLSRAIQMGGELGHDSKEDAVATADLVSKKVADKWKIMKLAGWKFKDGVLAAPDKPALPPIPAPKAVM